MTKRTCPDCGETIPANSKFCSKCGADLRKLPSAASNEERLSMYESEEASEGRGVGKKADPKPKQIRGSVYQAAKYLGFGLLGISSVLLAMSIIASLLPSDADNPETPSVRPTATPQVIRIQVAATPMPKSWTPVTPIARHTPTPLPVQASQSDQADSKSIAEVLKTAEETPGAIGYTRALAPAIAQLMRSGLTTDEVFESPRLILYQAAIQRAGLQLVSLGLSLDEALDYVAGISEVMDIDTAVMLFMNPQATDDIYIAGGILSVRLADLTHRFYYRFKTSVAETFNALFVLVTEGKSRPLLVLLRNVEGFADAADSIDAEDPDLPKIMGYLESVLGEEP